MLLVVGGIPMVVHVDLPAAKVLEQVAGWPVEAPVLLVVTVMLEVVIDVLLPMHMLVF